MQELKGWPFEPLGDEDITSCGEGGGSGGFPG